MLLRFLSEFWFELIVLAAVPAASWALRNYLAQVKGRKLETVAARSGYAFLGNDWTRFGRSPQLVTALFRRGRDGYVENVIARREGAVDSSFFDYSFRRGKHITHQTVAAFSNDIWLPAFSLVPNTLIHGVASAIIRRDVRLVSGSAFARRFTLRGDAAVQIWELFTPELVGYLMQLDPRRKWRIEGAGRTLVVYRLGRTVKFTEYPAFAKETSEIAKCFFTLSGLRPN